MVSARTEVGYVDIPVSVIVEAPGAALTKSGGPGATDELVGSVNIPVVRLTTDLQLLSTRIVSPTGWDTSRDVTMNLALVINATDTPTNEETLTLDFSYIYARFGEAAIADLGKPATTLSPALTFTTAEGLAVETLYDLAFTLARDDVTNPYEDESVGGFGFEFNIAAGSVTTSIDVAAAVIVYPTVF